LIITKSYTKIASGNTDKRYFGNLIFDLCGLTLREAAEHFKTALKPDEAKGAGLLSISLFGVKLASCILLMEPCADRMKPNVGTNFKFF
jgi:hypothetical protein